MVFLIFFLFSIIDKVDVLIFFKNYVGFFLVVVFIERYVVMFGFIFNVYSMNIFNFNFK